MRSRLAYRLHSSGDAVNPDSSFLRYPDKPSARIIALPAHLGGAVQKSGIKWISSFPENRAGNLARASAVLILNDVTTGYPLACIEASLISATRTAASAALAAEHISSNSFEGTISVAGTGVIACLTPARPSFVARPARYPQAARLAPALLAPPEPAPSVSREYLRPSCDMDQP